MSKKNENEDQLREMNLDPKVFHEIATGQASFLYLQEKDFSFRDTQLLLFREYVEQDEMYTGRSAKVLISQVLELDPQDKEAPKMVIGFRPPIVIFHQAPIDVELIKKVMVAHNVCSKATAGTALSIDNLAQAVLNNLMNSKS